MIKWTKQQARDFLCHYQHINANPFQNVKEVFDHIQMIQYDPLNVVGTNSELVLQSRMKHPKRTDLYEALYVDRVVIDAWDRQMSIIRTEDYSKFDIIRTMRAEEDLKTTMHYRGLNPLDYIDEVEDIIRQEGPKYAKDIHLGETKQHSWGSSKPSTAAIDYLFFKGVLGVMERNNTQKRYDLIERLIPEYIEPYQFPSLEDFIDYYLLRRIKACGLIWARRVAFYGMFIHDKKIREKHLNRLVKKGLITEIIVEGITDTFYAPSDFIAEQPTIKDQITFLAPLDNMTWDRDLLQELFDFYYIWEVYTPKAKRQFGYYVLPMIRGSQFIGRIEFEKHRNHEPLRIISIQYEQGVRQSKTLEMKLQKALKKFSTFLGASDIIYP